VLHTRLAPVNDNGLKAAEPTKQRGKGTGRAGAFLAVIDECPVATVRPGSWARPPASPAVRSSA